MLLVGLWPELACRSREVRPEAQLDPVEELSRDAEILSALRRFEAERRRATDFERLPPSQGRFGADPHALLELADGRVVGAMRGSSELVVLDAEFGRRFSVAGPAGAIGVAEAAGRVFAVGEFASELWVYDPARDFELEQRVALPGVYAMRDVASAAGRLFIVEQDEGRLLTVAASALLAGRGNAVQRSVKVCNGPISVVAEGDALLINCLLDHELVVFDTRAGSEQEAFRIRHDGPFWGVDLLFDEHTLWIAAGGVEDHPLDRTIGSFGYIDSFLYRYRIESWGLPKRVSSSNVSALGVITPKAIALDGPERVFVAGYGSPGAIELDFAAGDAKVSRSFDVAPGARAALRTQNGVVLANPLLDAWVRVNSAGVQTQVEVRHAEAATLLGEALFFTNLMAPFNESQGALSRFTCETCHFEGFVDGRTHHTGRGDVHATTKPLVGLFNNRPHFSRALDLDLSKIAHAEFRVAGANSGHDPMFSLERSDYPWLEQLGVEARSHAAVALRRALMTFLMRFSPPSNPRALGRSEFSVVERAGAELFLEQCERCHAARSSADDPGSRVPFERWAELVLSREGPLVWGSDEYRKTGVMPYVHPDGARTPSLRRLYKKRPYFTNGSARDLDSVLSAVRIGQTFWHQGGSGAALDEKQREALFAFLRLL